MCNSNNYRTALELLGVRTGVLEFTATARDSAGAATYYRCSSVFYRYNLYDMYISGTSLCYVDQQSFPFLGEI